MNEKRCMKCMKIITGNVCPSCGTDNSAIRQDNHVLSPGTVLSNRYTLGVALGEGGFGITYIGYDPLFDSRVAVKEYFPRGEALRDVRRSRNVRWAYRDEAAKKQHEEGISRFLGEAKSMAKLDAVRGIVRVRDTFLENETIYIVMDYVDGTTLKNFLRNNGTMKFSDCIGLLTPLMQSLSKMHKKGLIHRDISPDNIMILADGSQWLLDFGAAKDLSIKSRDNSYAVIKKGFSPPEQYTTGTPIGTWTDVYALTATIYYAVTGKVPPDALTRAQKPLNFSAGLREPLTEETIRAIEQGMALRIEDRIQTVGELLKRLKGSIRKEEPVKPKPRVENTNAEMGFSKPPTRLEWNGYCRNLMQQGKAVPEPPQEWVRLWEMEEVVKKQQEKSDVEEISDSGPLNSGESFTPVSPQSGRKQKIIGIVLAAFIAFIFLLTILVNGC